MQSVSLSLSLNLSLSHTRIFSSSGQRVRAAGDLRHRAERGVGELQGVRHLHVCPRLPPRLPPTVAPPAAPPAVPPARSPPTYASTAGRPSTCRPVNSGPAGRPAGRPRASPWTPLRPQARAARPIGARGNLSGDTDPWELICRPDGRRGARAPVRWMAGSDPWLAGSAETPHGRLAYSHVRARGGALPPHGPLPSPPARAPAPPARAARLPLSKALCLLLPPGTPPSVSLLRNKEPRAARASPALLCSPLSYLCSLFSLFSFRFFIPE